MSTHKSEQRRVVLRGREFHFVSYESTPANEKKGEIAVPAMWYLMNEGHRRQVMPHTTGQDVIALDRALGRWVEEHIFSRALADV